MLFIVMVSAGTAFAASDDGAIATDDTVGVSTDEVTSALTDDLSSDDSSEQIATKIFANDKNYTTPKVKDGDADYYITLTRNTTIPIPINNQTIKVSFNGEESEINTNLIGTINYHIPAGTPAGTYTMGITYAGTEKFAPASLETEIVIEDVATKIVALKNVTYKLHSIATESANYPILFTTNNSIPIANKTIWVNMGKGGDGDIVFTQNYTTNSLGIVNFEIPFFDPGEYKLTILAFNQDGYKGTYFNTTVTIVEVETKLWGKQNMTYTVTDLRNRNVSYLILLTTNATIPIPLSDKFVMVEFYGVGGEFYTNSLGLIKYNLGEVPVGEYKLKVNYNGTGDYSRVEDIGYLPSEIIANVTVTKAQSEISVDDVSVYYGDKEGKLVATITDDYGRGLSNANVLVTLGEDTIKAKTNKTGQIEVSTASLAAGNYTATIKYNGNKMYTPVNATANVVVNKYDTNISAVYDKDSKAVIATLTNVATGTAISGANVVINVDGAKTSVKTNKNGQAILSVADLDPNTYTAIVSYKGNSKYIGNSASVEFNTANTILTAEDVTVDYGDKEGKFVATLTDDNGVAIEGADVTITIGNYKATLKTNASGQVEVSTADLIPGEYIAMIEFTGNANYDPAYTVAIVTVNKLDTKISTDYSNKNKTWVINLVNSNGKPLTSAKVIVTLNNVTQKLKTDKTGQVVVSTEGLKAGIYIGLSAYEGNKYYNPTNRTSFLIVI